MTNTGLQPRRSETPSPGTERPEALARRILGEYTEMPGMSLTAAQAQRLFALESDVCERVFTDLLHVGALRCTHDGQYVLNRTTA